MLHKTPAQNKNSRRTELKCKCIFWQQVALMEQQGYSVFLVTAVNKASVLVNLI